MRLIENDRAILLQRAVALRLGQQDAIGHEVDPRLPRHLLLEPHLVADEAAERTFQFLRHPPRHARRRQPPRLGAADPPRVLAQCRPPSSATASSSPARVAHHHHHRMGTDRRHDLIAVRHHRQRQRVVQSWRELRHGPQGVIAGAGFLKSEAKNPSSKQKTPDGTHPAFFFGS